MSEVKLTPQQLAATENVGGPLLVSAAAGSGKTKVLVERLLKKVMASDSKCDVDDFLIITYTNAAAAELRGKILDAIYERIALDPENRRLRRQADLCGKAEIETIHSFCSGIIRENAHILGISPDFRVADDTESGTLKQETLSDMLDEAYDSGDCGFYLLADTMGAGRDDSALVSIILDTHTKLLSHPYPEKWVEEQLSLLNDNCYNDLGETVWGKVIIEKAKSWADYWTLRLREVLQEADAYPDFIKAYGSSLEATFSGLMAFRSALDADWDNARAALKIEFPRTKPVSGYDELKKVRNQLKDELKKISELFCDSSEKALSDMRRVAPAVSYLLRFVIKFDEKYSENKRKRQVIDFSDQEHLALRLLIDKDTGKPSETAKNISRRFEEIMVDEYQDVNAIQEMIFGAVSKSGQNIFMVGDVKQSIYRFRLADPTIFLNKYRTYKDAGEAAVGEGRKIILSKNFRSRSGVLDAANFIFKNVMSRDFGEMDYTEREALYPGAVYPDTGEAELELDVIDMSGVEDSGKSSDKTDIEARFAAGRIKELVGSMMVSDGAGGIRPARFGDVAILMRSPRSRAAAWTAALTARDVPVSFDTGTDFFETPEISIAVSLLTVIDNPRQDIPLISVLRSPVYGLTSEELGEIRGDCREGDFYEAVKRAGDKNEKCRKFLDELELFRAEAPDMPADEFLWHVLNKTGFFAAVSAMQGGAKRRDNLMLLLECAKKFESAGYKGLFGFVTYIRKLMEQGESPVTQEARTGENAVTIMSIHKSKGLEFPIVILADTTRRFNTDDSKKPLLIHPELGVGPKLIDTKRRIEYPTIARRAVREKIMAENMAEELRVLYVAMTRAREKLVILCTFADAQKELARLNGIPLPVPPQLMESGRCVADWILMPALRREECEPLRFGAPNVPAEYDGNEWSVRLVDGCDFTHNERKAVSSEEQESFSSGELDELGEKINWTYPYKNAVIMPSKVTATELKGNFAEEETHEDATQLHVTMRTLTPPRRPDFTSGPKKLTAAQKGTAAHLVMQYADYNRCRTAEGAAGEIERLRVLRNLTDEEAAAVRPEIISGFFTSRAGKLVLEADRLWRELKFSILVPSDELPGFAPGEEILLQGVVDCCAEKNGGLTVIDFKTDYVTKDTVNERAEYYRGQLDAYSLAMSKIMNMPVRSRVLYFLTAGIAVEL